MMGAKLACELAGVGYPQELHHYFGVGVEESEDHLRRKMEMVDISAAVHDYGREMVEGHEVDLSKLPEGVKAIRFENSW